jgi:hypothetical protein
MACAWLALLGTPRPADPLAVTYVDDTERAGLRFRHVNSATPHKYLIETMGGGVALLDYNGDGWLDVFFVNGARLRDPHPDGEDPRKTEPRFWNRLFRNNRDGTFTDVTEQAGLAGRGYGMGAAAADYDNDGDTDLLVTTYGGAILYRNNGDGTFTDRTREAGLAAAGWTSCAGFVDYDNDGRLDLFVCRYVEWNFAAGARVCGSRQPGGRAYCHPDEFPPIANYLFRNQGDGTFRDVSEASRIGAAPGKALGLAFADFDRDGLVDISVANDSFPQFLFRNQGDGTFAEVGTAAGAAYNEDGQTFAGMGTDFADLDGDGFPDIVTTALPYQYYVFFRNSGDGTFFDASARTRLAEITRLFGGWGMRVFDYDNDGQKDVFFANSHVMDNIEVTQPQLRYPQRLLLLQYRQNRFVDVSARSGAVFQQAWASRGAAFGDLDNDGDLDVVVTTCDGPAYLLRNEGGNRNHWLGVELRGIRSNRQGLGAEVMLTTESGRRQYYTVTTAGSYFAANDPRVFFGLGRETSVRHIRIRWPGGKEQVISKPAVDRVLKVIEEPEPGAAPRP